MCAEVACNASNLLMDIKPGYMLGAKPRQQAIGHFIGIVAAARSPRRRCSSCCSLADFDPAAGKSMADTMVSDQFAFPAAMQWKGVSDLVAAVFGGPEASGLLTPSIVWSMVIAAFAALVMEVLRIRTNNRFPLSPLAIGLGVACRRTRRSLMFAAPRSSGTWRAGSGRNPDTRAHNFWVETQEPICAGLIAGAALVGIGDILVKVFVLS